jgi:hypothetical protein
MTAEQFNNEFDRMESEYANAQRAANAYLDATDDWTGYEAKCAEVDALFSRLNQFEVSWERYQIGHGPTPVVA